MKKIIKNRYIALAVSLMMIGVFSFGVTGCGGSDSSDSAGSDEVFNLTMTVHSASTTAYAEALDEWAAEMAEKSDGRLNIEISYGGTIAAAENTVDVTAEGGADLCWSTVPINNSKFKYIHIFSTFGEDLDNSMSATKALIDLYNDNSDLYGEFDALGLKLVGVHALTPNALCAKDKKFESTDDFKGQAIMAISASNIAVLEGLGAVPMGIAPTDLFENYSKNVCDASLVDASLYESTSAYEEVGTWCTYNFSTCVCFIAMNQGVYDSLPDDLKALIDDSFESLSMNCGEKVNTNYQNFVGIVKDSGIDVYDINPDLMAEVENQIQTAVVEPWKKVCDEDGIDGDDFYNQFKETIEAAAEEYGDDYSWYK